MRAFALAAVLLLSLVGSAVSDPACIGPDGFDLSPLITEPNDYTFSSDTYLYQFNLCTSVNKTCNNRQDVAVCQQLNEFSSVSCGNVSTQVITYDQATNSYTFTYSDGDNSVSNGENTPRTTTINVACDKTATTVAIDSVTQPDSATYTVAMRSNLACNPAYVPAGGSSCWIDGINPKGIRISVNTPLDVVYANVSLICNGTLLPDDVNILPVPSDVPFKVRYVTTNPTPQSLNVQLQLGAYAVATGSYQFNVEFVDSLMLTYTVPVTIISMIDGTKYPRTKFQFPPSPSGLTTFFESAPVYPAFVEDGPMTATLKIANTNEFAAPKLTMTYIKVIPADPNTAPYILDPANPNDPNWPVGITLTANDDVTNTLVVSHFNETTDQDNLGYTYIFGFTQSDKFYQYNASYFGAKVMKKTQLQPCSLKSTNATVDITDPLMTVPFEARAICPAGTRIIEFSYPVPPSYIKVQNLVVSTTFVTGNFGLYADGQQYTIAVTMVDSTNTVLTQTLTLNPKFDASQYQRLALRAEGPGLAEFGTSQVTPTITMKLGKCVQNPVLSYDFVIESGTTQPVPARTFSIEYTRLYTTYPGYSGNMQPKNPDDMPSGITWVPGTTKQEFQVDLTQFQDQQLPQTFKSCLRFLDPFFSYEPACFEMDIVDGCATPVPSSTSHPATSSSPGPDSKKKKFPKWAVGMIIVGVILAVVAVAFVILGKAKKPKYAGNSNLDPDLMAYAKMDQN